MTELLKENGELNRELDQLRCQANGQINELHQDKNNVNEELHRATREVTQAKSAVADLRAANAMLKNELTVTKRDTKDLRLKLEEEQKRAKEAAASHQLTADHYKGLLTKARQEIILLKSKMAGAVSRGKKKALSASCEMMRGERESERRERERTKKN